MVADSLVGDVVFNVDGPDVTAGSAIQLQGVGGGKHDAAADERGTALEGEIGGSDLVAIEKLAAVTLDGVVVIQVGQDVHGAVEEIDSLDRVAGMQG